MIVRTLLRWFLLAAAIWLTTQIIPGIEVSGGVGSLLWVAALFAVINLVIGSVARLLTFPLMLLTLGLFGLVINALMLMLTDYWSDSLRIDGFWTALLGGLCVTILSGVLNLVFHRWLRRSD